MISCVCNEYKEDDIFIYIFDESVPSAFALAYTSQPYSEVMDMRPSVTYTPYAESSKEQTGDIITFAQFEEGNLLSGTREDAESDDESSDKYDDDSIMPQLISK